MFAMSPQPLVTAVEMGRADLVAKLYTPGFYTGDQKELASQEEVALITASYRGYAEIVKILASKIDVNQSDTNGFTPLIIACQKGHIEVVKTLLAANADVDQANNKGVTPLWMACKNGHTEIVTALLAANASVDTAVGNQTTTTPLAIASQNGHTEVVTTLIDANAAVDQAANDGITPLCAACLAGHTEVVTTLIAANAAVDQASTMGVTPMYAACLTGHLGVVQLLSSYGARRTRPLPAPDDTAEHVATREGHADIVAWLPTSHDWSALHHLEALTPARAIALLNGGGDVHRRAGADGPTPLDRAKELCSSGQAAAGSAAHVVLEWGAPWSRATHKFYPPEVRARVAELMRIGQLLKRDDRMIIEVWEAYLVKHVVASAYWR